MQFGVREAGWVILGTVTSVLFWVSKRNDDNPSLTAGGVRLHPYLIHRSIIHLWNSFLLSGSHDFPGSCIAVHF